MRSAAKSQEKLVLHGRRSVAAPSQGCAWAATSRRRLCAFQLTFGCIGALHGELRFNMGQQQHLHKDGRDSAGTAAGNLP